MSSTRQTTEYLKGLTIIVVMVTHYLSGYSHEFYSEYIRDYNGFIVSVFFVMSGYGLYYSFVRLQERYGGQPFSLRLAATFFWQRALRIYPLFWLSLISASLILPFPELHELSLHDLLTYLAVPTIRHPGYTWFIPALVQCYLVAPFFYFFLRKLGLWRYLALVFGLGAVFFVISVSYVRMDALFDLNHYVDTISVFYQSMFLSNILLFAAGMSMPLLYRYVRPYVNNLVTIGFLIAFLGTTLLVRDSLFFFHGVGSQVLLFPLFLISVSGFCLSAVTVNGRLPLSRAIAFLGVNSFALYLFHWQYYFLLSDLGLVKEGEWLSAVYAVIFFPLLLVFCVGIQKLANMIKDLLQSPFAGTEPAQTVAQSQD